MVYVYKVCLCLSISAMLRPFWPTIYIKLFLRIFANWTISDIFRFFLHNGRYNNISWVMCDSNLSWPTPPPGEPGGSPLVISDPREFTDAKLQPRDFHWNFSPHAGFSLVLFPAPRDFTLFSKKKWNCPGGVWVTINLNHTLWKKIKNVRNRPIRKNT